MNWNDQPAGRPAHSPPESSWAPVEPATPVVPVTAAPTAPRRSVLSGARRGVATALFAVGLLVVGGVAVVSAADPSASAVPEATTAPTTDGGGDVAPDASSVPGRHGGANGAAKGDCPDKGTGGTGTDGTDGSGDAGSSAAPSTDDSTASPSTVDL